MNEKSDSARRRYLAAKRGDLTSYAGMIGEEFSSKINSLAQILGDAHEPSIGAYKESLLRSCIEKFIPKRYSVCTGFIVFISESYLKDDKSANIDFANLKEHSVSHQIDVIVFDDNNYAPIFRDKDFVLVRPESVKAIIEVKGFIKKSSLAEDIGKLIELGRKWNDYNNYLDRWGREKLNNPAMHMLAWDQYVDKSGKQDCDGRDLRRLIVKTYRENLRGKELEWDSFPKLNAAYIYNDCCVGATYYINSDKDKSGNGYATSRGKFVRYDEKKEPFLDRDATISSLLASIHVHLDTPFNPDFSYFDQTMQTSVLPHECQGITDWVTGEDVEM